MVVISDIRSMFWGVTIDAGKRYSQTVTNSFHLSMAALEPGSGKEYVQVMIQHSSSEFLLCSLREGSLMQQPLDLIFAEGEEVSFSLIGKGIVHLTGYILPDQPEDTFSDEDSDEESDAPQLVEMDADLLKTGQKRKALEASSPAKKKKLLENFDDDDYDSEEDEDYEALDDSDDDEDDDDEDDDEEFSEDELTFDEDEDGDEEESSEEESPVKPKKAIDTPKSDKIKKDKHSPKTPKTPKSEMQTPQKSPETPSTPANGESSKKKKKKKNKKSKDEGSPSPSDKSALESTPKSASKGKDKTPNANKADTPKSASKAETPGKRKVVSGGTVIEDLKVGHGPEAKSGKMVSVYYVGSLTKNNKRFDSCTGGKPFRFRLKQGEVIKGWDNGVEGMKVGGKRKITVPANQGYGNQRQGPIPPNSSLTFEVELKAVS